MSLIPDLVPPDSHFLLGSLSSLPPRPQDDDQQVITHKTYHLSFQKCHLEIIFGFIPSKRLTTHHSKQISPAASPSTLRRQSAASNGANASASSPSSWFMAWNPLGKKPFLTARPTLSQGLASHLEDREGDDREMCY